MGSSQSKLEDNSSSLEQLSVEDVETYVTNLGVKYLPYGAAIAENAVDGAVLASISDQDEMKETMECLEITNFLHQKVLLKEWNKAKGNVVAPAGKKKAQRSVSHDGSFTMASSVASASEITLDTDISTAVESNTTAYARPLPTEEEEEEHDIPTRMPRTPGAPPAVPVTISVEHQRAIEPLQLPKDSNILPPESPELEPFRQLAKQVLRDLHGSIAETNIVDISHFENRKGMNNLATAFPPEANAPQMRCHFDKHCDLEICRRFVLGQNEEYYEEFVPAEVAIANGLTEAGRYYGQVIKLGNLRVGTICSIVEESNWHKETDANRKASLEFLATIFEQQLERRQVLLQRNQNLRQDIEQLKNSGVDQVVAPPYGPVKAVLASQVATRQTLFPYPLEPELGQDNGHPTSPQFTRRSVNLPAWQFIHQASGMERSHLGKSYVQDDTRLLGRLMDQPPVGKNDMERVAMINSLQVLQMDPLCQEAQTIQSLMKMGATLLGADFVFLNILDHEHRYVVFPTYPQGVEGLSKRTQSFLNECHEVVREHPQTGHPFIMRTARRPSICNYAVMSPNQQSFVVHDLARDQSLALYKELADFGFYSGSPVFLRGHAVAVLCATCVEARPDFGRAQEVQQEQLAQLIAQQYDTWALKREMIQLERERSLMVAPPVRSTSLMPSVSCSNADIQSLCKMRANRPEDYAALIFTSIQGASALALANHEAFQTALELHNRVLRAKMAEHGGYEVSVKDGSFHIAFTDVVDAVKFCLQAQEALHGAPWAMDILTLPGASEDALHKFRGFRVCMAVHCGDVESTTRPSSGQQTYSGEAVHVTKSLESMSHGGQVLLTADVWNVAHHLVESSLGSPQVIDLGTHVIPSNSSQMEDGITRKRVLQLVPKSLAHDYSQSRKLGQDSSATSGRVLGRVFPTIKTRKSVSPSFHNAPFDGNKVIMLAVNANEVEGMTPDPKMVLMGLSNLITTMLSDGSHSGYQCKDFLLAFEEVADAVRFGLALQERLRQEDILDLSLHGKIRIGVHEGVFDTMGPNPVNGRAEYAGKVVGNATLIADAAAPGCVYLGEAFTGMDDFNLMPVTNGFMLDFHGRRSLQAEEEEFVLHKCEPCKSWYDQMLDNRRSNLSAPWRGY